MEVAESVRETVGRMEDAWNRHDAEAYGELFTDDAEWVNIVGMWWRGKAAIRKTFETFHERMFRDTPLDVESVSVREISADTAVAVVTWRKGAFVTPGGHVMEKSRDRMTLVMVRRDVGWLVTSGHNTTIDEAAVQYDPAATR